MAIGEHAKLTPAQHADEHRIPTGRLTAYHQWPGLNELHQAFFLPGCQLCWTTAAMVRDQAAHPVQDKGLLPVIEARWAEAPALTQHRYGYVVHQQVDQHGGAPHQPHIIALIGVLKTAVERFDGGGAELYPDSWVYPPIELLGTCSVRDTPVCSRQPALNFQFIF
jgi:hypothetical protein